MKLAWFGVEEWLNPMDSLAKINLGSSCVKAFTMDELFKVTGQDEQEFLKDMETMSLHYHHGDATGSPRVKAAVAGIYPKSDVTPDHVMMVHGGTGANNTVVYTLIEPSDNVISIMPNYQQYYSIPRSIGAEVREIDLKPEDGYKLNLSEVRKAVDSNTKAIMLTNPNNPTGSLLELEEMQELVAIAKSVDAWIVCDEMYRGLKKEYMPSMADLYDKAIVTCSSSKIYSMAGTRCGWIICRDPEVRWELFNRRSYDSICGGVFDEWIFAIALEHADKIFERSRNIVEHNKAIVDKWLDGHKYLHQYADAYGTTYLIHYDLNVGSEKFCDDLLDQKGVLICHGDCFYLPHTFRLSLSHAEELEKGLTLIDEYIEELISQGKAINR